MDIETLDFVAASLKFIYEEAPTCFVRADISAFDVAVAFVVDDVPLILVGIHLSDVIALVEIALLSLLQRLDDSCNVSA